MAMVEKLLDYRRIAVKGITALEQAGRHTIRVFAQAHTIDDLRCFTRHVKFSRLIDSRWKVSPSKVWPLKARLSAAISLWRMLVKRVVLLHATEPVRMPTALLLIKTVGKLASKLVLDQTPSGSSAPSYSVNRIEKEILCELGGQTLGGIRRGGARIGPPTKFACLAGILENCAVVKYHTIHDYIVVHSTESLDVVVPK